MDIRRTPPAMVKLLEHITPKYQRITDYMFAEYERRMNIPDYKDNYDKWKRGINFNTKRKITIGGYIHRKIGKELFRISEKCDHNYHGSCYCTFADIEKIKDVASYKQYTIEINEDIAIHNRRINEMNAVTRKPYDDAMAQINSFDNWDDYIVYDGIKYGKPCGTSKIHEVNKCDGVVTMKTYIGRSSCHNCECWYGCGREDECGLDYTETVYICDKCGVTDSKS